MSDFERGETLISDKYGEVEYVAPGQTEGFHIVLLADGTAAGDISINLARPAAFRPTVVITLRFLDAAPGRSSTPNYTVPLHVRRLVDIFSERGDLGQKFEAEVHYENFTNVGEATGGVIRL